MAASDTVVQLLRQGPQTARALYERLGVSQPTLSRLINQHGESILRLGKARQTQYALRRKIGSHNTFPLYRINPSGDLEQWGLLHPIMPEGYLVETWATQLNKARTDIHLGLPWYLQDMRPQGFLGRFFARFHGPALGLPDDPNRWSDDQSLLALANTGYDTPGNLLIGEASASYYQTIALFSKTHELSLPLSADLRLQKYPELAQRALAGEVVGSSAGGEQPKFNVKILRDGQTVHVMVKFTAPQDNDATRRWRSLLICEHLAFQVLGEQFPHSQSELLSTEVDGIPQLFLEAPRFDRVNGHGNNANPNNEVAMPVSLTPVPPLPEGEGYGRSLREFHVNERGRLGVVSLKALDDEFTGLATDWPKIAAALVQSEIMSDATYQQVQRLYAFGVLIGNADMHPGNISFLVDDLTQPEPEYVLAPVYDMLPMSLAPRPSGQIPDTLPLPRISVNPPLGVWKEILPLAIHYWHQVAAHPGVAEDVKQMAKKQAGILSQSLT